MGKRTRSVRKEQRLKAARARERGLPTRQEPAETGSSIRQTKGHEAASPVEQARQSGWPVWAKVLLVAAALVALLAVLSTFRRA